MKVLVTGFEPFRGEKVNPALEAIKGYQMKSMVLRSVG